MKTIRLAFATLAIGLAGCSSLQKNTSSAEPLSQPTPATVNAAAKENASGVTEISFAKNSAELTEEARHALVDTLNTSEKIGSVDEVKILAWADADYPSENKGTLSKADRKLADLRAANVRSFLKSITADMKSVETYNMAARPNGVARLFKSDDARVKNEMESAGLTGGDSLPQTRVDKMSTAVVMFLTR